MGRTIYTDEKIREIFSKITEYTLLDILKKEDIRYIKIKHTLCGKEYMIRVDKFFGKEQQRCSCLRKRCTALIKGTEDYNNFLNKEYDNQYTTLSEYLGRKYPITVKHLCGFEYNIERAEFLIDKTGGTCPVCNKRTHNSTEIIQKKLERLNLELLEGYKGVNEKHIIRNKGCGHEYTSSLAEISRKSDCPICVFRKYSKSIDIERVKTEVEKKDLVLISEEYSNTHTHLQVKCEKCYNEYFVSRTNILSGKKCPYCSGVNSTGEKELKEFIISIYSNTLIERKKFKKDSRKYELDIYLPDLNIGFEYNGLYWHSDLKRDKNYHIDKTKFFKDLGIRIVHIFEDEWLNKQNIVKIKIKNILGVSDSEKVPARKIVIKEISNREKTPFLESYHIQSSDHSEIKLGGFYNNELVAVMTFSKLRNALGNKIKKLGEYELSRYASSKNVVGGFSKLLKYAIRNYDISFIKTFADLRWSDFNNNVYSKNGFTLSHISNPNYFYVPSSGKLRIHRFNFRKQVLEEKFPDVYKKELTEFQIMDKTKYSRIWDCGNLVYELTIKR